MLNHPQSILYFACLSFSLVWPLEEKEVQSLLPLSQGPNCPAQIKEPPKADSSSRLCSIQGLVFLEEDQDLLSIEELKAVHGVEIRGLKMGGKSKAFKQRLEALFLHQPIKMGILSEIREEVEKFFQQEEDPFILVIFPPQPLKCGVIQIVIQHAKLGEMKVEGNCWFSEDRLLSYLDLKQGERVQMLSLKRDLDFMNRNPFRHVNIIYSMGKNKGETDITLLANDERPYRFYTGADNTGIVTTDRQRIFTGFSWAQVFGWDHLINFQYLTSYNFKEFQAYTGQYMAFLPWKQTLNIYGGYTKVYPTFGFPVSHRVGKSGQCSLRYTMPLSPSATFCHEWTLGVDYKITNNTVEFSALFSNYSKSVNLTQLMARYFFSKEISRHRLDFEGQIFWSPGSWLPDQTNGDYNSLRPGARNQWVYATADVKYIYRLPRDFTLRLWVQGQLASQNLLPSEQLGIGGYSTVRGYNQNQLTMDEGIIASLEARSPPYSIISFFRNTPVCDALQGLAFVDYGYGKDHNGIPGIEKLDYLLSAGPGLRYTLTPYFSSRLDWGIKLHREPDFTGGWSMVHFSVSVNY